MLNGPRSRILVEGLKASCRLLLFFVLPLAAACLVGTHLPEEHTAAVSGLIQAPPARVWELLTDFSVQENWRRGPLVHVRGPKQEGSNETCWMEGWLLTKMTLCAINTQQERRRVVRTLGTSLPFDATWTFDLSPDGNSTPATNLSISEQTSIESPMERFVGRYLLRRNTAAQQYLRDLQTEALRHP